MRLKTAAIAGLIAVMATVMAACGSAEDGKVTTTTAGGTSTTAPSTGTRTTQSDTSRTGEGLSEKVSEGITELESGMSR
ncbi:MAG: hypothetical protein IJN81_11490, partial [Clostridia bacterium]|nr:hypothetical protein [Clostridia bacterium]